MKLNLGRSFAYAILITNNDVCWQWLFFYVFGEIQLHLYLLMFALAVGTAPARDQVGH